MATSPITIWRFTDGKLGHEKQSLALIESLSKYRKVCSVNLSAKSSLVKPLLNWIMGKEFSEVELPSPDLIIGAGHKTHLDMLLAKRKRGGKIAVIMTPSLPLKWFDIVIAPEHDFIDTTPPENVITTLTALASFIDSDVDLTKGLILLGGESKHFYWDNEKVIGQIKKITEKTPEIKWSISNSRRTPKNFFSQLMDTSNTLKNVNFYSHENLGKSWLSKQLKTVGHILVTCDSASMIAEALHTNANIDIISLDPYDKKDKLYYSVEKIRKSEILKKRKGSITENIIETLLKKLAL